jgi:hypothetical protein
MRRILSLSIIGFSLFFQSIPTASALLDWRSARSEGPRMESCDPYLALPKRTPAKLPSRGGADVYIEQQVVNAYGQYVNASSAHTAATVRSSDTVSLRLLVRNASLFDVAEVVLNHRFSSLQEGLQISSARSVAGASYHGERHILLIPRIARGDTAVVTFLLQLNNRIADEMSESIIELVDFTVLNDSGEPAPTIGKGGLESIAAVCFLSSSPAAPAQTSTAWMTGISGSPVLVQVRASALETLPGGEVSYTLSITNQSKEPLENVRIDDRFNIAQQQVIEAPNALRTGYGLQWIIPVLSAGERFTARYRARIAESVEPGMIIPATVTVTSASLVNISPSKLSDTVEVRVLGQDIMPRTGVDLLSLLFLILSSAVLLYAAARNILLTGK